MDESVLKDLRDKHGEVIEAKIGTFEFAFKIPTQAEFRAWTAQVEKNKERANELTMQRFVVYPPDPIDALYALHKPLWIVRCCDLILKEMGALDEAEKKEE